MEEKGVTRRIIIGSDYKNAMVIKTGQEVINGQAVVCKIERSEGRFWIWIREKGTDLVRCWKDFPEQIVSNENDVNLL